MFNTYICEKTIFIHANFLTLFIHLCDWSSGGFLQISDQILPVFGFLEAGEQHLGTGNELLWIGQIRVQRALVPHDALVLVGVGVAESGRQSALTSDQAVQVRSDFVLAALLDRVALGARTLEYLLALLRIAHCV